LKFCFRILKIVSKSGPKSSKWWFWKALNFYKISRKVSSFHLPKSRKITKILWFFEVWLILGDRFENFSKPIAKIAKNHKIFVIFRGLVENRQCRFSKNSRKAGDFCDLSPKAGFKQSLNSQIFQKARSACHRLKPRAKIGTFFDQKCCNSGNCPVEISRNFYKFFCKQVCKKIFAIFEKNRNQKSTKLIFKNNHKILNRFCDC